MAAISIWTRCILDKSENEQVATRRIVIIDGHPDQREDSFCRALVGAYASGAATAGHGVHRITLAHLAMPISGSMKVCETSEQALFLEKAWEAILWADHLVIVYPLWFGSSPALLQVFFEQIFKPRLTNSRGRTRLPRGLLCNKSARIIVTMGRASLVYRMLYFAYGVSARKWNILNFAGTRPIATTLIGSIETTSHERRQRWLSQIKKIGRNGR